MLFKILILALLIFGIYLLFIKPKSEKKASKKEEEDIMVECNSCKTYISSKEAIIKNGKYYCSKKCADI